MPIILARSALDAALKEKHRIGQVGIEPPEKKQLVGNRSKKNLSCLAFKKTVLIGYGKRDLHGRIAGNVMLALLDVYPYASGTHPKTLDAGRMTLGRYWRSRVSGF